MSFAQIYSLLVSKMEKKTLPYTETFRECAEAESEQKTDQRRCLRVEDIEESLMQITIP